MNRKTTAFAAMLAVAALSASPALAAQNLGQLMTSWSDQLKNGKQLIGILAYLGAFATGLMGIFKLKAASKNPNDPNNKVSTGLIYIGAAALLVALPSLLGVGVASFFGGDGAAMDGQNFDLNMK